MLISSDLIFVLFTTMTMVSVRINGSINIHVKVNLFETVNFFCSDLHRKQSWQYNNDTINVKKQIIIHHIRDRAVVMDNYSLQLKDVLLSDEGIYTCLNLSHIHAKYMLNVKGRYTCQYFTTYGTSIALSHT